jgi:hypothetical protein
VPPETLAGMKVVAGPEIFGGPNDGGSNEDVELPPEPAGAHRLSEADSG